MSQVKSMQEKLDNENSLKHFKTNIDKFIDEIEHDPEKIENLSVDEITELRKYLQPYNTISGDTKYTCMSVINIDKDYQQKLLTTSMIGFLYRMCDEYEILDEELNETINENDFEEDVKNPDYDDKDILISKQTNFYNKHKYEFIVSNNLLPIDKKLSTDVIIKSIKLSESDELHIQQLVNNDIKTFFKPRKVINRLKMSNYIDAKVKEQSLQEQQVIMKFLNKLFEFNPDLHTESVYHENLTDIERKPLKPVNKNEKDKIQNMTIEQLLSTKIPPNDTFLRFNYYYEQNYENMRDMVSHIYSTKSDLDFAINVFESFNSKDEAENYVKKHKNEIITDIVTLTNNNWNIMGPFKENRERVNFYNENTAILESIFKQQEDDSKLGSELMKDRIKKKKMRNIRHMGKDSDEFKNYIKKNPNAVKKMGAIQVNENGTEEIEIIEEIEISETGSKIDADGCPEDAVEIGVTSINAKTGKSINTTIYSKSKKPE